MPVLDRNEAAESTAHARAARGVVLLTGGTSGIGLAAALALTAARYHVVATGLPGEGEALLEKAPRGAVTLLTLNLADPAQIEQTAKRTQRLLEDAGLCGLAALVNNAGVTVPGPVELLDQSDLRRQFEINVFGQLALTQAVLPLLRAERGRIVNIGSAAGRIATPFLGALTASKAAFRAMNDALRLELQPCGVTVVHLEPGRVTTPALGRLLRDCDLVIARMSPEQKDRYAAGLRAMVSRFVRHAVQGAAPETVAAAIVAAVTADNPPARHPIGATPLRHRLLTRLLASPVSDRLRHRLSGPADLTRGASPGEVRHG